MLTVNVKGCDSFVEGAKYDAYVEKALAAWDVLDRGGWCMQVDGHGTVHVRPKPTGPVLELNRSNARLLMPGIEYADDHASIPNRFTAVAGERSATAVNDDPASVVSTVSRGFVVDEVEDGAVPVKFDRMEVAPRKDYLFRTEWNVTHSDATLIIARKVARAGAFHEELTGGVKQECKEK